MSEQALRSKLIRLAYSNPALRADLLPLIKQAISIGVMPRSSYLPKDNPTLVEVSGLPEGLTIYTYTQDTARGPRFYGVAFANKANTPLWNYSFRSEGERNRQIQTTVESFKANLERKQKIRDERKNHVHGLQVGDILTGSWGYDQTNVEFYQVVKTPTPKTVEIREIGAKIVRSDLAADYVAATPGKFVGPVIRKTPTPNGIAMKHFTLRKWDGNPKYQTSAHAGH